MAKQFWLNLPVKNVNRSKDFFKQLGFTFNEQHGGGPDSACMLLGDQKVVCMLFEEATFRSFIGNAALSHAPEVLLSIDAQSKEEVDDMVAKAIKAGGTSTHKPGKMTGWMYGTVFTDLDGHRWNVLHMDMSKMKQN
jgi:predicted lactoylglutathione lyase